MIVDSMTKAEIIHALKNDHKRNVEMYIAARILKYQTEIQLLTASANRHVKLPWETIITKSNITYMFRPEGDREYFCPKVIAEFPWQGKKCFAYFTEGIKGKVVNVFTNHALSRYAERVLNKEISYRDVFYQYILPHMSYAFRTVLPSPNQHEYSKYITISDGLFLGDFDPKNPTNDDWYNTCISLNETGESQHKILKTLKAIQNDLNTLGFNPFDLDEYKEGQLINLDKVPKTKEAVDALIDLARLTFLLNKLYLMLDYPFYPEFKGKIDYDMFVAKGILEAFKIDYTKLTPYGKDGIAIRGELEYKGEAK